MNKKYLDICIPEEIENDPKAVQEYLDKIAKEIEKENRAEEERIFRETGEIVKIKTYWA